MATTIKTEMTYPTIRFQLRGLRVRSPTWDDAIARAYSGRAPLVQVLLDRHGRITQRLLRPLLSLPNHLDDDSQEQQDTEEHSDRAKDVDDPAPR
jgi:hypothetical protein